MANLSEGAWRLLTELQKQKDAYIPRSTVEKQWSPESLAAFQELIQAGMVEEITVYRVLTSEEEQAMIELGIDPY